MKNHAARREKGRPGVKNPAPGRFQQTRDPVVVKNADIDTPFTSFRKMGPTGAYGMRCKNMGGLDEGVNSLLGLAPLCLSTALKCLARLMHGSLIMLVKLTVPDEIRQIRKKNTPKTRAAKNTMKNEKHEKGQYKNTSFQRKNGDAKTHGSAKSQLLSEKVLTGKSGKIVIKRPG